MIHIERILAGLPSVLITLAIVIALLIALLIAVTFVPVGTIMVIVLVILGWAYLNGSLPEDIQ